MSSLVHWKLGMPPWQGDWLNTTQFTQARSLHVILIYATASCVHLRLMFIPPQRSSGERCVWLNTGSMEVRAHKISFVYDKVIV